MERGWGGASAEGHTSVAAASGVPPSPFAKPKGDGTGGCASRRVLRSHVDLAEFNRRACELIERAVPPVPRPPETITDPHHCSECEDHARTLAAQTLESLSTRHVGGSWDPTCFMSDEGFRYWFPALVRIASEQEEPGYWGMLFGFYLGSDRCRQGSFGREEQVAILQVFEWMLELFRSYPEEELIGCDREELEANAAAWRFNMRWMEGTWNP